MAMIDPPIEEVFEMAGSRYALCTVVAKRAKELMIERPEFFNANLKIKPIEFASNEFYEGKFKIQKVNRS